MVYCTEVARDFSAKSSELSIRRVLSALSGAPRPGSTASSACPSLFGCSALHLPASPSLLSGLGLSSPFSSRPAPSLAAVQVGTLTKMRGPTAKVQRASQGPAPDRRAYVFPLLLSGRGHPILFLSHNTLRFSPPQQLSQKSSPETLAVLLRLASVCLPTRHPRGWCAETSDSAPRSFASAKPCPSAIPNS